MNDGPIVSNASPLIALEQIGRLDVLRGLFEKVTIPLAVEIEIKPTIASLPIWIPQHLLSDKVGSQIMAASLGAGESAAIALSLELSAERILLDDRPARRLATALGIPVLGTLGILLAAKRRGMINAIRPELDSLKAAGFHVSRELLVNVLKEAGE